MNIHFRVIKLEATCSETKLPLAMTLIEHLEIIIHNYLSHIEIEYNFTFFEGAIAISQ